jgi:hypothetical protein
MENSNTYIIPNSSLILNKYKRKCSFCNCEGHTVASCNDELLVSSNNYLIYLKNNLLLHHNNKILAIQDFENHIYDYYTYSINNKKLLKAIACRFYRTRLRSLLIVTINKIILHLFDIEIAWLTFNEYNLIPFNENSPIKITTILEGIINLIMINNIMDVVINNNNYDIKLECFDNIDNINSDNKDLECSVCYNSFKNSKFISLNCKHEFCIDCTEQFINKNITSCPFCRNKISTLTCYTEELYNKLYKNKNS